MGALCSTVSCTGEGEFTHEDLPERCTPDLPENPLNFNIFKFIDENEGRMTAFVRLAKKTINPSPVIVDGPRFERFLVLAWARYNDFDVSYHNDIHGLDVMHMTSIMLDHGLG